LGWSIRALLLSRFFEQRADLPPQALGGLYEALVSRDHRAIRVHRRSESDFRDITLPCADDAAKAELLSLERVDDRRGERLTMG
jgi:hypothetical protein